MNLSLCSTLSRSPENGTWYRLILLKDLPTALSSLHTRKARSRFNPGTLLTTTDQFAALYFADDPVVAQFEVGAVLGTLSPGGHIPHPRRSGFVILNVNIILRNVVDLTDLNLAQIPLETTAQELTPPHRITHVLAVLLNYARLHA